MPTLTEQQVKEQRAQAHAENWTGPEANLPPGHNTFGSDRPPRSSGVDLTPQQVAAIRQAEDSPDHHLWD